MSTIDNLAGLNQGPSSVSSVDQAEMAPGGMSASSAIEWFSAIHSGTQLPITAPSQIDTASVNENLTIDERAALVFSHIT